MSNPKSVVAIVDDDQRLLESLAELLESAGRASCFTPRRRRRAARPISGHQSSTATRAYGARLRDDEPRMSRDDPRGGHDIAVVGRSVEKILNEERRRPAAGLQAAAEIH